MTATLNLEHGREARRAELADRLTRIKRQIRDVEQRDAYPDAPRRHPSTRLQAAAEALAAGHDVEQPPNLAELRRDAALVKAALDVLDAQAAADQLASLAGAVEAQTAGLRKALAPWAKWIRSMPAVEPLRVALDDLRSSHADRLALGQQTNGQPVTQTPVFDDAAEHVAAECLNMAERLDVLVKDADDARL